MEGEKFVGKGVDGGEKKVVIILLRIILLNIILLNIIILYAYAEMEIRIFFENLCQAYLDLLKVKQKDAIFKCEKVKRKKSF